MAASLCLNSCGLIPPSVGAKNELVLKPGERVDATTPNGEVRIEATDVQQRRYVWSDQDRSLRLGARDERWYGGLGAYGQSGNLVADEEQYDFASERAFRFWLTQHSPQKVYSRDGYVVGLGRAPNGNTDIELFHVCIAGKAPQNLSGGDDDSVRVAPAMQPATGLNAWYGCARETFDPISPERSNLRQSLDIARQVNFWDGDAKCDVTGDDSGTAPALGPVPGFTELVLVPGERLRAINRNGPVTIEASDERSRTIGWTGDNPRPAGFKPQTDPLRTVTVGMLARTDRNRPDRGSLSCTRLAGNAEYIVDFREEQLNFARVADFEFWRTWLTHGPLYLDYVFRNDGLLVGYELGHDSGESPMLNVELYRICIAGKPPRTLPGANDAAIAVTGDAKRTGLLAKYGCAAQTFAPRAYFADYQKEYAGEYEAAHNIEDYEAGK